MARYSTSLASKIITGTHTIVTPDSGAFTALTGTAPYTVTLPDPRLYPGINQTFFNSSTGTVTLSTPSGNFNGTGGSGTNTVNIFTGNVVSATSDGVNYVVISEDGSALVATSGSFSGNVDMNGGGATVTISPNALVVNPASTGSVNNVNIGASNRGSGAFTSLTANSAVTLTANTTSTNTSSGTLVVTGGVGVSGAVNAGSVSASTVTGTLQTAAQPNITSVGTLTGLTVTNTITGSVSGSAATVTAAAQPNITSVGTLTGLTVTNTITGSVSGSAATASTVTTAAQPNITSVGTLTGLTVSGDLSMTGTGAIKVPVGTTAQRPAGQAGLLRFNTTNNQLETFLTSTSEWSPLIPKLGTITRPATSARAILDAGDSTGDGVYYIQSSSGVVQVYCDMTNGGYMLVAKISSTVTDSWLYNGSNWTGTSPVNESGVQTLANENSVSRLYYEFTLQLGFRMCLGTINNALLEARTGNTARSFFLGSQSSSQNSRAQFLSWFQTGTGQSSSNFDNQANCNTAGFNVTSASSAAHRWGITMNNENDCSTNDSGIGFGTYTNNQTTSGSGVRNVGAGGHRWSPDVRYPALGFIFVR